MTQVAAQDSPLPEQIQSDLALLGKQDLHEFLGVPPEAAHDCARHSAAALLVRIGEPEAQDALAQANLRLARYCQERFQADPPAPAAEAAPLPQAPDPALSQVLQTLNALREEFAAKIRYDATKERQIDKLHADLQEQKQDVYFKTLRPLFVDLISLQDHLYDVLKHAPAPAEQAASEIRLRTSIQNLADVVDSTLERYGVSAYQEEGELFTPQRQRAEKPVDTENPALDRHVAERLRKGFVYDGRILRPELVATYRLKRG